jgi:hypothetical protein
VLALNKVVVGLRPVVGEINLPTVLKTVRLPGDSTENLFIATRTGEIFYVKNDGINTFLDISELIIEPGTAGGGYDERGLLGLAFHPHFYYNGLFYLHYSVAGTQGQGALQGSFEPDPCDPGTLNLEWTDREEHYDHIDTVEEWVLTSNNRSEKLRTLLNIRRPFANHNGVNSLNFSPETGRLVFANGDGGSGYDPFNLSRNIAEIAGKIIEIDVDMITPFNNTPVVTRFDELPAPVHKILTVIARGVRNIPGIAYQRYYDEYVKYVGNVGQNLVESVFSFYYYKPVPVTDIINGEPDLEGLIDLGWRGWEGDLPTPVISDCDAGDAAEKTIAYYDEVIATAVTRIPPLAAYYHIDNRPDKFEGSALTGVQPYAGSRIPGLTGNIVFADFARRGRSPSRGVLAYTEPRIDYRQNDYSVIDIDYDFRDEPAWFVSLGSDGAQSKLYLGVYGSSNVTDLNLGTVFEIV